MPLTEDQWHTLATKTWDNQAYAEDEWDTEWARYAYADDADPSGEYRFTLVVIAGLDLLLSPAGRNVATASGGGESGQWNQYFDHLETERKNYIETRERLEKILSTVAGVAIGEMQTISLTPVLPGYANPGSPGYTGDPRYLLGGGPWADRKIT